jgi:hypothetical protein
MALPLPDSRGCEISESGDSTCLSKWLGRAANRRRAWLCGHANGVTHVSEVVLHLLTYPVAVRVDEVTEERRCGIRITTRLQSELTKRSQNTHAASDVFAVACSLTFPHFVYEHVRRQIDF